MTREDAVQHHSGVTSDVAGLNLNNDLPTGTASNTTSFPASTTNNLSNSTATSFLHPSATGEHQQTTDEQMLDLNLTASEMEPQQTLPQDVDMLPASTNSHHHHHHHHHHRRDLEERVFDRVIEALNQDAAATQSDDSDDSGDSDDYESQNRIIHIEADTDGDQIHIQIETGDEDDEDDSDEDSDEDDSEDDDVAGAVAGGVAAAAVQGNTSSGDDDRDDHHDSADDDHVAAGLLFILFSNILNILLLWKIN